MRTEEGNIPHHRWTLRISGPEAYYTSFNRQNTPATENQPEEEEDGSAVANPVDIVVVIHEGLDGIDEAWVKLLGLVEDEQSLGATQHHVPDGFSQLALETAWKITQLSKHSLHKKIRVFMTVVILTNG